MAELVEGNDKHLERVEDPSYVWYIPEQSYDDDVGDDDAEGGFLCGVDVEGAGVEGRAREEGLRFGGEEV